MSGKINLVISALEKKIMLTECRGFKYKGAQLSTGDASTIIFYLKRYAANGSFFGLMEPVGSVKTVLDQVV
jgi:hypothetical protein